MAEITRDMLLRAIGMADAAKLMCGERGNPPSRRAVLRWADVGWRATADARPIVLRSFRRSRDLLTLPEWVEAFERERAASLTCKVGGAA